MTRLRVNDLLAGSGRNPAPHLDPERVARYAEQIDAIAPVIVFETEQGLLLADGYHRVAGAKRRGMETIEAELREGSREDALRYAARIGAAQHGVSVEDAMAHIQRHAEASEGRGR